MVGGRPAGAADHVGLDERVADGGDGEVLGDGGMQGVPAGALVDLAGDEAGLVGAGPVHPDAGALEVELVGQLGAELLVVRGLVALARRALSSKKRVSNFSPSMSYVSIRS